MEVAGPLGTPLGLAQRKRASPRGEAGTSGFLSVSDSDRRVPAELGQESQASSCLRKGTPLASRVAQGFSGLLLSEEGNPAGLSSCSGGLRTLVELCVEPAGVPGRGTGVSVPLRVVPSTTGLPLKRCPGIRFFSRADREIGVIRHVAPPAWRVSDFLVRPASS